MKKILLLVVVILIVINVPPLKWVFGQEDLLYSNSNGSFTFDEVNNSGRNYKLCMDNFEVFKSIHKENTLLFRVTPINILEFWRWGEYVTNEKYKLPYKSWKVIEGIRGPVKNKTNWQAF
jgi:hypothetical protein